MAREKRPANAPCRKGTISLQLFVASTTCVLLDTQDANAGKRCVLAQPSARRTAITGSGVLEIVGMGSIGSNYCPCLSAIMRYVTAYHLDQSRALVRLDGQYGLGAVIADVASFAFVTRGKEYTVLDHPLVQARLHLPADQIQQRPESQTVRRLYDCSEIAVGPEGLSCRVVVATHPVDQNKKGKKKKAVGVTRAGLIYELFFTNLPQHAFTARDVVEVYLHRGAFEPLEASEDEEIDPDRWCSHSAWGQECWQTVSQWVWNLRLELGHQLEPTPLRITEFAPAIPGQNAQTATRPTTSTPASGYGLPATATSWKTGRLTGQDFPLQSDGTLRCPAGSTLTLQERRQETDGSLRLVYAASIRSCRSCELREQCQWNGSATKKPRQVSVLLHPLNVGREPLLWQDWSRRVHRRACIQLLQHQRVEVSTPPPPVVASPSASDVILSRAERAHSRLSWQERLVRNGRVSDAPQVTIKLFGVPRAFALWLGLRGGESGTMIASPPNEGS